MSASNDGLIPRYALPGVSDPVLPADIVNKEYVDNFYNGARAIMSNYQTTVTDSIVLVDTHLQLIMKPHSYYFIHVWGEVIGFVSSNIRYGFRTDPVDGALIGVKTQLTNKDTQPNTIAANGGSTVTPLVNGNTSRIEVTGHAFNFSDNPATVIFQVAQGTAIANTTRFLSGSVMILTQLRLTSIPSDEVKSAGDDFKTRISKH